MAACSTASSEEVHVLLDSSRRSRYALNPCTDMHAVILINILCATKGYTLHYIARSFPGGKFHLCDTLNTFALTHKMSYLRPVITVHTKYKIHTAWYMHIFKQASMQCIKCTIYIYTYNFVNYNDNKDKI